MRNSASKQFFRTHSTGSFISQLLESRCWREYPFRETNVNATIGTGDRPQNAKCPSLVPRDGHW
jgi:hypothetical protein